MLSREDRIRAWRSGLRLRLHDLAAHTSLTVSFVDRFAYGVTSLPIGSFCKISEPLLGACRGDRPPGSWFRRTRESNE